MQRCWNTNSSISFWWRNEPPGAITANTESYDGTSWTEVNDLNDSRRVYYQCGTHTSALAARRKLTWCS